MSFVVLEYVTYKDTKRLNNDFFNQTALTPICIWNLSYSNHADLHALWAVQSVVTVPTPFCRCKTLPRANFTRRNQPYPARCASSPCLCTTAQEAPPSGIHLELGLTFAQPRAVSSQSSSRTGHPWTCPLCIDSPTSRVRAKIGFEACLLQIVTQFTQCSKWAHARWVLTASVLLW
jgi:hypothetical protein